ncbi:MAG: 7-cyano-7-deazaguanine synthase QueC [Clostridiales bacterium]|nr:7-cyano-7-deazaguanine synthase QueC [Clostridiales bacterium]
MKKALVVLSGGQDSTTCLYWAVDKFGKENVTAVGFDYGQRHKKELECAADICAEEGIAYEVIPTPIINQLSANSLTRTDIPVEEKKPEGAPPNTFVEGRNLLFLSYAAIYAKTHSITEIVTGVCETDFSGYPDCRDIFVKSLNVTLNLAMEYNFVIHTPLMWLDKSQTWELADKLGVIDKIYKKTLTCYNGVIGEGCGHCPACFLRRRGYEQYMEKKKNV